MAKFKVGEVAIIHGIPSGLTGTKLNGCECEVTSIGFISIDGGKFDYGVFVEQYPTTIGDGSWGMLEAHLRKKRPPKEDEGAREWFNKNIEVKQPERV